MKDYTVFIQLGVSFDERNQVFDLLEAFRAFLDEQVLPDNFDYQDIKLGYHVPETSSWGSHGSSR